jgi:hypothetical protein
VQNSAFILEKSYGSCSPLFGNIKLLFIELIAASADVFRVPEDGGSEGAMKLLIPARSAEAEYVRDSE